MGGEIDDGEVEGRGGARPVDDDEVLGAGIAGPGGVGTQNGGGAMADGGVLQCGEELVVERGDFGVGRFDWAAGELDRDVNARAGELAFVEEAHAGQTENNECGGAMLGG